MYPTALAQDACTTAIMSPQMSAAIGPGYSLTTFCEDMANLSETRTSTEQLKASGSSTKGIILLENVYRAVVYEGISFCTPIEHKIFVFMICALKLRLQTAKRNAIVNSLASEWHGLYMHLLYNNSENPIEWKRQQYPN